MSKLIEITGKAISGEWGTDDEMGTGIPVLRTTNFTNEGTVNYKNVVTRTIKKKDIREKYLRPGDIILEKSGGSDKQPVGRVVYYDGPLNTYLFNNFTGLLRVQDQKKWYPRYVFYSLFANYRKGGTRAFENKTTGLHNLKVDDYVSRYVVANAEYSLQVGICDCLDRIAGIIMLRKQELQELDDLIKARFVEMFGGIKEREKIATVCKRVTDFVASGSFASLRENVKYYNEPNYCILVKTADFANGFTKNLTYTDKHGYEFLKNSNLFGGELILPNIGASIGKAFIVPKLDVPMSLAPNSILIDPCDRYYVEYLYHYFLSHYGQKQLEDMTTATATPKFNKTLLKDVEIIAPSLELQKEFAEFCKQIDKSKAVVQKALDEAQLLFDSLMQKFFG